MSLQKAIFYSFECDECGAVSDDYQYGQRDSQEFKGRGTIFARRAASADGWSTFSTRDLCPEHSAKRDR